MILNSPSPAARAEARIRATRQDVLAELSDESPQPKEEDVSSVEDGAKAIPSEVGEPVDSGESVSKSEELKTDEPDPKAAKGLAKIQAAEKRSLEKLAAEKAAIAEERAKIEQHKAEVAAFLKAKEKASVDPVSVLKTLGIDTPEALEYLAKQAYAASKPDHNNKEAAARLMRDRERDDETKSLREELQSIRQEIQAERARAEAEKYVGDLSKQAAAGELSPLAKHFMNKSPEKTVGRLRQIAVELLEETGDRPDVEDVLARYEKVRRSELEELGIDPASLLSQTTSKKNDQVADKKHSAKTLANDLSTPRVPRTKSSEREARAEILALIESGKLD